MTPMDPVEYVRRSGADWRGSYGGRVNFSSRDMRFINGYEGGVDGVTYNDRDFLRYCNVVLNSLSKQHPRAVALRKRLYQKSRVSYEYLTELDVIRLADAVMEAVYEEQEERDDAAQ